MHEEVARDVALVELQEKLDKALELLVKLRDITPDYYPDLLNKIDEMLSEG